MTKTMNTKTAPTIIRLRLTYQPCAACNAPAGTPCSALVFGGRYNFDNHPASIAKTGLPEWNQTK